MAEEYSWSWETPDYGYDWMTPQEEAPVYDFGGDVDWGNNDYEINMDWMDNPEYFDYTMPAESNPFFMSELSDPNVPSWYSEVTPEGSFSWNDPTIPNDYYGTLGSDPLSTTADWRGISSLPTGETYDFNFSPPDYGYDFGNLYGDDSNYEDFSSFDDSLLDDFGYDPQSGSVDDWLQSFLPTEDVDMWGDVRDESGNIDPSLFTGTWDTWLNPAAPQEQPSAEGRFPAIRDFFGSMLGLGPAGPNAAGVTGRRRPQSPFAGGLGVTPEWMKRIGDRIGLGGRSGLQDAYVTGYPEETGQGIFGLRDGQGSLFGGDGLGSLFGDGDGGGGMGKWMMPLGLGILAAQAAKDDRGVDLTPSVTMDPLGRYTLSGTGPEERKEFGLGEIPTSLDFSAYEDIMGGS
jgi:hypothetical protein